MAGWHGDWAWSRSVGKGVVAEGLGQRGRDQEDVGPEDRPASTDQSPRA